MADRAGWNPIATILGLPGLATITGPASASAILISSGAASNTVADSRFRSLLRRPSPSGCSECQRVTFTCDIVLRTAIGESAAGGSIQIESTSGGVAGRNLSRITSPAARDGAYSATL